MRALLFALTMALGMATPHAAFSQDYAHEALPDPQLEAQAVALMDTLRCVVCQGQPISGSDADIAGDMRRIVRERIAAGQSPEEIRQWLISRYGDYVSFKPRVQPNTILLWLVPLVFLLGGGWLASRRLGRRSR